MYIITKVTPQEIINIIDTYKPKGLFYCIGEDGTFTAVDNSTGEAWTENFKTHREVYKFLKRK